MSTRAPWMSRARAERGSLSIYFVMAVLVALPLVGLVIDGIGQIRAHQQANLVAEEAARSAAQKVELGDAIQGLDVKIDGGIAEQAAEDYVAAQGDYTVTSITLSADRQSVTVTTTSQYRPLMLDSIGIGPRTITADGTAYMHRTDFQGEEYDHDPSRY